MLSASVQRREQGRFVLTFVAIAAVLFCLYGFPYAEHGWSETWFDRYLQGYARMAGAVLGLVESNLVVSGTSILGRYSLRIVKTCDAMEANILFCAAILAFPGRWSTKLLGMAAGLAALVAVNVLRICTLYYVGLHFPAGFAVIHEEVWPFLLIGSAVGIFLVCVRRIQLDGSQPVVEIPQPS